jgi:hypothetical protein
MRDRLLKGRSAQRLVAGLAPPFDRKIVETSLGEMMGDCLRLSFAFDKRLCSAAVQRLPAALE